MNVSDMKIMNAPLMPLSVLRAVAGSPSMLKFFAEADDALAQRRLSFLAEAFK